MEQNDTKPKPTNPHIKQEARLKYIESNLLLETQEEMAAKLDVSRSTIVRDLDKWKETGGFKRFLISQWIEKYQKVNRVETNNLKLLDRITNMIHRLPPETQQQLITDITLTTNLDKIKHLTTKEIQQLTQGKKPPKKTKETKQET